MAIQMRRGNIADYDPTKIRPGEWAVATDAERVFIGVANGAIEIAKKSDIDEASETILDAKVKALESIYGGEPSTVDTVAEMTNTDLTYIYSGSETGYTAGHWYYWDGTAWTDGGQYAAGMVLDEITDYILESYVTDSELTSSGVTFRRISDTQVAVFGTATANRRYNIFNGQHKVMTTTSAFDPILPAGTYKIAVSAENLTSGQVRLSLTYNTYSNTFVNVYVGTSKLLECTDPIMFGVNVPNGTAFGTESDPTIITVKVESITAKDEVARANAEKANSDVEKFVIYNTASGAVASFSDGADDYPIKGLTVAVEPVQAGSGDPSPSNVRPISGWSEVKVTRTGKNLLKISDDTLAKPSWYTGTWTGTTSPSEGAITVTRGSGSGGFGGIVLLDGLKAGTYVLSGKCPTTTYVKNTFIGVYDGNTYTQSSLGSITPGSTSFALPFTLSEDAVGFCVKMSAANSEVPITFTNLQIELGSTATSYEPYQGNTYTISLGDTVYGGTLDVVGGKMVVDRVMVDLGTLTWRRRTANRFSSTLSFYYDETKNISAYMSNTFTVVYVIGYAAVATHIGVYKKEGDTNSNIVYLGMIDYGVDSLGDLSTWLTNNPTYLVCPLFEPVEISLTPIQINTLLGVNNVYSDAGDVSVEYPADTKQFILNAIASALV